MIFFKESQGKYPQKIGNSDDERRLH